MAEPNVSKEFIEKIIGEPVEKFQIRSGSNLGDGYTCAMISVDIWKKSNLSKQETILIKCFPTSASRQEILDQGNTFVVELGIYKTIIPILTDFQKELGVEEIVEPPFPKFIYGNYTTPEERKQLATPMNPVENCIVMPDLREKSNGAFRLRDRFLGLDYHHYILIMEAHAKVHSISWAYKRLKGIQCLEAEFPFLVQEFEKTIPIYEPFIDSTMKMVADIVKDSPKAVKAVEHLNTVRKSVNGMYFDYDYGQTQAGHTKDNVLRNPGPVNPKEEPWKVLLHGDAWSNNMLFRYDPKTNRPVECLLVDLQLSREGDPFSDLAYTMYASGTPDLRRKHLNSLLHVYYDTFESICHKLKSPLLPGWSWEEVNRRFHRARALGGIMASILLPIALKNPEELANLDGEADAMGQNPEKSRMANAAEFFSSIINTKKANPILTYRLTSAFEELRDDGVL